MSGYRHGWFQVAYESDLTADVSPVSIGARRLIVVRRHGRLGAYDADCPHRGMHLGIGGKLAGNALICPFHGLRIGLGQAAEADYAVCEYPLLAIQGLVFVRLSQARENGLSRALAGLSEHYRFVPGLTLSIRAAADLVMENGVDRRHFDVVHGVTTAPFALARAETGALEVRSAFRMPVAPEPAGPGWRSVGYEGTLFSPGVYLAQLGDAMPSHLGHDLGVSFKTLTCVTDHAGDGTCTMRLTFIVPGATDQATVANLRALSLRGIEDDRVMWENVNPAAANRLGPEDAPISLFRQFCDAFR